jgi:hypothetical protein
MNQLRKLIPILLLISSLRAQEQFFDLGTAQVPPGVSWQSLESPHFRVIFPREIEGDAQQVARLLEHYYEADTKTLGVKPGRLPLILHTRNTESNGFVTLAPRRSEWYNTPPQVGLIGPVGWYPLLAIHEYRHVVQFQAMKRGCNKLLYYALGEIGWLAGAGFSVPAWFFEGDAVTMETALTRGGRGRQPEFLMPIRTMLLSGKRYSYYKMNLGSYKNWIGNPYDYGFVLSTWLRRQHGPELWPQVLKSTATLSFIPYRFSWSLKRRTGMGCMKSHAAMLAELDAHYRANMARERKRPGGTEIFWGSEKPGGTEIFWGNEKLGGSEIFGNEKPDETGMLFTTDSVRRWNKDNAGFWTIYQAPQPAGDGSVIALKLGLADQSAFVRVQPDGREEVLFHIHPVDGSPHSLQGGMLLWAEKVSDPRWGNQDFLAIKRCDLATGAMQTVVAKGRYFAPALSPDGSHIAAILSDRDNCCRLVLLDGENGREIQVFENPGNAFLMTPRWSPDGSEIVFNRLTEAGRALTILSLADGRMTDLIPPGAWTITTPIFYDDHVLFSSNDGDVEEIFAVGRRDGRLWRVTTRLFGAFYPAVSSGGSHLFFSDYDLGGYHIAEMSLDPARWRPIDRLPVLTNPWFEPVAAQEAGSELSDDLPAGTWPVKKFGFWRDLFRIHSWDITADEIARTWGARLYSQNLLGTLQASAGYDFDRDEDAGAASASLTWARFYPLIDAGFVYGHRASSYLDPADKLRRYTWQEKSGYARLRLPLNLSRQGYSSGLTLQSTARLTWLGEISDEAAFEPWENRNGWCKSAGYALSWYRYRISHADIFPVYGQFLRIGYDHTPWSSQYRGERLALSASLYFPGAARRHGLALRADYEEQTPENYRYSSEIRFPRGYDYRYQDRIGRLAVDYTLPLAYPDQHLWALLYIQRIKSLFFHDYGWSTLQGRTSFYRASGAELTADLNFLSLPVVIEMGVRLAYRWHEKSWRSEAVMALPL